jgi:hypothetical protein
MAETTFGRRLRNTETRTAAGLCSRPESWNSVREILARLVSSDTDPLDGDLLHRGERVLVEEILERLPDDVAVGSALLGVTPPTYRRRLADVTAGV